MLRDITWKAFVGGVAAAGLALAGPVAAQTPMKVTSGDGANTVSLGLLSQGLAQLDSSAGATATDLCFRRLRFMTGGRIAGKLRFFIDTDAPYVGQHQSHWSATPIYLQDLIITWEWRDQLQLDAGLLLVPTSYNATQSAASLLPLGYSPYAFLGSGPTHSRVGRDQGLQVRGYLSRRRLEYRLGTYEGVRKHGVAANPRVAARVAWHPFGAQPGFFYAGTAHGSRRQLSAGASIDHQDHYTAYSADAFTEWPLPRGTRVTLQADYTHYSGELATPRLPRQHAWMIEAAYAGWRRLGVFAQVAHQNLVLPSAPDGGMVQAGALWWVQGHRCNVKLGVARLTRTGAATHVQVSAQTQVLVF